MGFPTIIAERKGKSSSGKMKSLVALTLVLAVAAGDMMLKKKIHHDMMVDASQAMCWGQGNMFSWKLAMMNAVEECHTGQQSNIKPANPFAQLNKPQNPFQTLPAPVQQKAVPRNPFQSANAFPKRPTVNPDSLGDFSDFKDGVASKMSNLTCVLSKMNMLDADYQVNLKMFTEDFWKDIDMSQTLAAEDPVWSQMLVDGYNDCYDIARSFPQSALNKNPIMKVFGRHMVFFKCTKKVDAHGCGMAQAAHMLETLYGSTDNFDWSSYGLPNNKYERAAMSMKVMYGTSSPEEAFVHNFFYADPMM